MPAAASAAPGLSSCGGPCLSETGGGWPILGPEAGSLPPQALPTWALSCWRKSIESEYSTVGLDQNCLGHFEGQAQAKNLSSFHPMRDVAVVAHDLPPAVHERAAERNLRHPQEMVAGAPGDVAVDGGRLREVEDHLVVAIEAVPDEDVVLVHGVVAVGHARPAATPRDEGRLDDVAGERGHAADDLGLVVGLVEKVLAA